MATLELNKNDYVKKAFLIKELFELKTRIESLEKSVNEIWEELLNWTDEEGKEEKKNDEEYIRTKLKENYKDEPETTLTDL